MGKAPSKKQPKIINLQSPRKMKRRSIRKMTRKMTRRKTRRTIKRTIRRTIRKEVRMKRRKPKNLLSRPKSLTKKMGRIRKDLIRKMPTTNLSQK